MNSTYYVPWDLGALYSYFWICYIIVLLLGVIFNFLTFLLITFNENIKKLSSVETAKYLVVEDLLFSTTCLIQCCINYHVDYFLGEKKGCLVEAWYLCFFVSITGYSLCLISYMVRLKVMAIKSDQRNNSAMIFKIQVVFWIFSAIFSTAATVWPGYSRLNSSGTYCVAAFNDPLSVFFFFRSVRFSHVYFFGGTVYLDFCLCRKSKAGSSKFYREKKKWKKNIRLAMRLGFLVVVYFVFYAPVLGAALYEWCTGKFAPPLADLAGVFAHVGSAANPLIYLWSTKQALTEFRKIFCSYKTRTLSKMDRMESSA